MAWSTGIAEGTVEVTIVSGTTNKELLNRLAQAINGSTDRLTARVVARERVSSIPEDVWWTEAVALEVSLAAPKQSERLSLSESGGTLLHAVGLTASAWPGADALAHIDGMDAVSETNTFALDQGRVLLTASGPTGATKTLRLVQALPELGRRVGAVIEAANSMLTEISANADLFSPALAASWTGPARALAGRLSSLGLAGNASGLLDLDQTAFASFAAVHPEETRAALLGPDGLFPAWSAAAAADPASFLVPPSLLQDFGPPPALARTLEQRGALLEVIESAPAFSALDTISGILNRRG